MSVYNKIGTEKEMWKIFATLKLKKPFLGQKDVLLDFDGRTMNQRPAIFKGYLFLFGCVWSNAYNPSATNQDK